KRDWSSDVCSSDLRRHLAHVRADLSVAAWNPNLDNAVFALAVSGGTLYAGGDFSSIGGQARRFIAALDTATGLATQWNPGANGSVPALAVSSGKVYAGGSFFFIGGQARSHIAALDTAATGAATAWAPGAESLV